MKILQVLFQPSLKMVSFETGPVESLEELQNVILNQFKSLPEYSPGTAYDICRCEDYMPILSLEDAMKQHRLVVMPKVELR
jgi:hypothetical protein